MTLCNTLGIIAVCTYRLVMISIERSETAQKSTLEIRDKFSLRQNAVWDKIQSKNFFLTVGKFFFLDWILSQTVFVSDFICLGLNFVSFYLLIIKQLTLRWEEIKRLRVNLLWKEMSVIWQTFSKEKCFCCLLTNTSILPVIQRYITYSLLVVMIYMQCWYDCHCNRPNRVSFVQVCGETDGNFTLTMIYRPLPCLSTAYCGYNSLQNIFPTFKHRYLNTNYRWITSLPLRCKLSSVLVYIYESDIPIVENTVEPAICDTHGQMLWCCYIRQVAVWLIIQEGFKIES